MSKYFVEAKVRARTTDGDEAYCYEVLVGETGVSTGGGLGRVAKERIRESLVLADGVELESLELVGFRRIG